MPQHYGYHLLLAGTCAHLGQQEEARNAVSCLTEHTAFIANPRFELRKWNLDEDLIDVLFEGLRLAGMEL